MKEESEKADLKLNIQNAKIMASSPIASWQIDGETMETVTNFIFLGPKITAENYKKLTSWKKNYDQSRQYIKRRNITLPTEVRLVKAIVFSSGHVWM